MSDQKQLGLFDKKEEYNDNLTFDKIRANVSTWFDKKMYGTYPRNTDNRIIDIMTQKYFEKHRERIEMELLNNERSFESKEEQLQCQGCRSNITIGIIYKIEKPTYSYLDMDGSEDITMTMNRITTMNRIKYYCYKCGYLHYMATYMNIPCSIETILYTITESLPY